MNQRLWFLLLLLATAGIAAAQAPVIPAIPVNPQTVDQTQWVTTTLTALQTGVGTLFLGEAQVLLRNFGLIVMVLAGLRIAIGEWIGRPANFGVLYQVIVTYVLIHWMLNYYVNPLPLIGYSFHEIFTAQAKWLAAQVDITILDQYLSFINSVFANTEKPHYLDIPAILVYFTVLANMLIIQAALFVVTSFAFFAIGIGVVWGPFAIVSLLFRQTSFLFSSWIHFMVKYCMYRVVAAMLVFVWVQVIMNFFLNTVHGDYTLGHWLAILPAYCALNLAGFYAVIQVPHIAHDLTSGSSNGGSGFGGFLTGMVMRAFL